MKLNVLHDVLRNHPDKFPRFVLPDGDYIPAHAHITEVGYVVRNFIDCGGVRGNDEKVVLQTHLGDDFEHRLRADRFAKILNLGSRILPDQNLDVAIEYDCCVVAQYPIIEARPEGAHIDIVLERGRTQCRARERRDSNPETACCDVASSCC